MGSRLVSLVVFAVEVEIESLVQCRRAACSLGPMRKLANRLLSAKAHRSLSNRLSVNLLESCCCCHVAGQCNGDPFKRDTPMGHDDATTIVLILLFQSKPATQRRPN